jgi:hypothetical protein
MGKRTVRRDILDTCGECGRRLRPCNLMRHVAAAHPGSATHAALESQRISELLRLALDD